MKNVNSLNSFLSLVPNVQEVKALVESGALFAVSNSGGKDSQAMMIMTSLLVPAGQIVSIYSSLKEVVFPGTAEKAAQIAADLGIAHIEVKAKKTFFDMVRHRRMFPSPQYRQCTSDLKRGPIEKAIKAYMKANGFSIVVSAMGLRAQESDNRACGLNKSLFEQTGEVITLERYASLEQAGRTAYRWLPVHAFLEDQVFSTIEAAGQEAHWAYRAGMGRLSCCFCIMATKADLACAAGLMPELYQEYVKLEREVGFTMFTRTVGKRELKARGLNPETDLEALEKCGYRVVKKETTNETNETTNEFVVYEQQPLETFTGVTVEQAFQSNVNE
jgi:DNA sulfur modification protein DndC